VVVSRLPKVRCGKRVNTSAGAAFEAELAEEKR
jgi:hypothetical protein